MRKILVVLCTLLIVGCKFNTSKEYFYLAPSQVQNLKNKVLSGNDGSAARVLGNYYFGYCGDEETALTWYYIGWELGDDKSRASFESLKEKFRKP